MKFRSASSKPTQTLRGLLAAGVTLISATSAFAQLRTPQVQSRTALEIIEIRVTRFGPYPEMIKRPRGAFLLSVVNQSGELDETFSLVLKPASKTADSTAEAAGKPKPNPSLLDLHTEDGKQQRDHELIDPLPGHYQLRIKSHPDWAVDITVTEN